MCLYRDGVAYLPINAAVMKPAITTVITQSLMRTVYQWYFPARNMPRKAVMATLDNQLRRNPIWVTVLGGKSVPVFSEGQG